MLGEYWIGADSGGRGNLGLAFLDTSGGLICATVSSVDLDLRITDSLDTRATEPL